MSEDTHRVIIVTGLSGAGKSSALRAFEDIGYHVVDNCPLPMLLDLIKLETSQQAGPLALGVDIRSLAFSAEDFTRIVKDVRSLAGVALHVLLMDAHDDVLLQRFSENRRRHPLTTHAATDQLGLRKALAQERALMDHIRPVIDGLVDTSDRFSTDTRRLIRQRFALQSEPRMLITIASFGFSRGLPRDADMVVDVRFLRNPHYVETLRSHTGQHEDVANYVRADTGFQPFIDMMTQQILFLLPRYAEEGKTYFTLAFGCTGGKHRSVMTAETMAHILRDKGFGVAIDHRDMPR